MKDEEELWVNVINGAPLHHRCKSASPTSLASGSWRWRYLHNQQPRCVCGVHVKYPGKAGLSPPPHGKELHRNQMFNKYIHRRLLYSQFPTPNNYIYIYLKKLNINVLNTTLSYFSAGSLSNMWHSLWAKYVFDFELVPLRSSNRILFLFLFIQF